MARIDRFHADPPVARMCPRCGTQVRRIRRRWLDHVTSPFLALHRYRCIDAACGWQGVFDRAGVQCSAWQTVMMWVAAVTLAAATAFAALFAILWLAD